MTMHKIIKHILHFHRDQRGSISIITVFVVILLTMLLGMVVNVGGQTDGKIRLQNAADAAAYSGGVTIARGMNSLSFTNHLLADVFAMTAFMREARDRNAQSYTDDVLAAWLRIGPVFESSGFEKFEALGAAIQQKVPVEQQLINTWSDWSAASSALVLPTLEEILRQEMIPAYQRSVVEVFPDIAQATANEIARRHGGPVGSRGEMLAVLWRTSGEPVGFGDEFVSPTLSVVDPVIAQFNGEPRFIRTARRERRSHARSYLLAWNNETVYVFHVHCRMSQYFRLWSSFTNGQLERLLEEEYPDANLPHVILTSGNLGVNSHSYLLDRFTFLAVAYRHEVPRVLPGLFRGSMRNDTLAYAAARVFVPRRRLVWDYYQSGGWSSQSTSYGGVPGNFLVETLDDTPPPDYQGPTEEGWRVRREHASYGWDLQCQRWTCNLVPGSIPNLATILQTVPPVWFADGQPVVPPNLAGVESRQIQEISPH